MTVLSSQSIRKLNLISPFVERSNHEETNTSYGLSAASYDVRLDQNVVLLKGGFRLASTLERFHMPNNLIGIVHDKSTWIRRGLALQNSVIDPGFSGWITLELTNHGDSDFYLREGTPIAQIVFHRLDETTEQPYPSDAKYQGQQRGIQVAL